MALRYIDGFDIYGDGADMLDGLWLNNTAGFIDTSVVRTGAKSLRLTSTSTIASVRKGFGAELTTVGIGFGVHYASMPASATADLLSFRDKNNAEHCALRVRTEGTLEFANGDGTVLAVSTAQVLTAAAYHHIEILVTIDDAAGAVEVRLNGVSVLSATGLDTTDTAEVETSQFLLLGAANKTVYFDDLVVWDTTGAANNDFLGDVRVHTLKPDSDQAAADWAPNTGTGWAALDDSSPDDDTTHVEAADPGDVSEYGLEDLPGGVSQIIGVMTLSRLKKSDSGDCQVQVSVLSDDVGSPPAPAEANGADRAITPAYTYWADMHEVDPATGAPWLAAAVDGARLRLDRTV